MGLLSDALYLLAALVYSPVLAYQMLVQRKNRIGWRERMGHWHVPPPTGRPRIWLHAVSLGEVNCTPLLVGKLHEQLPDCEVIISTTTDTGYARACQLYGNQRVFRYPLDFTWVVRRVLNRVQPDMIVLTELEVWYNLVTYAHRGGIPVAVINGRLTERSFRRFRKIGPIARQMFSRLTWVGAQDEAIAQRFIGLGTPAERVEVTGSLKWDTAEIADTIPGADTLAAALGIRRDMPLWVCGSTGPGEEAILLDAYRGVIESATSGNRGGTLQLVIVPRKPERFDEVAKLIESRGYHCIRRSRLPDGAPAQDSSTPQPSPAGRPTVILGDTMGELRKFYSLADVVFVGRSLVPMGGSDPMEVAALGKPIIAGPHMENFALPMEKLQSVGAAIRVGEVPLLDRVILDLLIHVSPRANAGAAGRSLVQSLQGATSATASKIIRLLSNEIRQL